MLIPLLFMGDVVGRLFHEFAITLAVTIIISAVVSLTLVPMLCARLLKHAPETQVRREGVIARLGRRAIDGTIASYGRSLRVVLDHQGLTLLVALGTLALTAYLFVVIPKGFFPVQDTGRDPGHHAGGPVGLLRGDGRAPAAAGRDRSSGIRTSPACPRSSASTARTSRSIPAGC